jgi:hypothetical protein
MDQKPKVLHDRIPGNIRLKSDSGKIEKVDAKWIKQDVFFDLHLDRNQIWR